MYGERGGPCFGVQGLPDFLVLLSGRIQRGPREGAVLARVCLACFSAQGAFAPLPVLRGAALVFSAFPVSSMAAVAVAVAVPPRPV